MSIVQDVLRYTCQLLVLAVGVKLLANGLYVRYKCFELFLTAELLQAALLFGRSTSELAYAVLWSVTSPLVFLSQLAAAAEVFALVCEHYPRIGSVANLLLKWCLGLATLGALAVTTVEWQGSTFPYSWFHTITVFGKTVTWGCAGLLCLQALFFRLFPVPLRKNVQFHRWLFLAYCFTVGIAWVFVPLVNDAIGDGANTVMLGVQCALFAVWFALLSPARDAEPNLPPPLPSEQTEAIKADFQRSRQVFAQITWRSLFR